MPMNLVDGLLATRFTWTGTGTGDIVPAAADDGYRTPLAALDGELLTYEIVDTNGVSVEREIGQATWTDATQTLARSTGTVLYSTNGGALVAFVNAGQDKYVSVTPAPSDLASVVHGSTHIGGGADAVPVAVSGGAAGLQSGADKATHDTLVPSDQVDPGDANWTYVATLGRHVAVRFTTTLTADRDAIFPAEVGLAGAMVFVRNPGANTFSVRMRIEDPAALGTYVDFTLGPGRVRIFRKDADSGSGNAQWWTNLGPDVLFTNQWELLIRTAAGFGEPTGLGADEITEDATPAAGNKLLGFVSGAQGAAINLYDVGNLPASGGGGFSSIAQATDRELATSDLDKTVVGTKTAAGNLRLTLPSGVISADTHLIQLLNSQAAGKLVEVVQKEADPTPVQFVVDEDVSATAVEGFSIKRGKSASMARVPGDSDLILVAGDVAVASLGTTQVAFQTHTLEQIGSGGATTITETGMTVPAGTDQVGVVFIGNRRAFGQAGSIVTGITWNGVAMTEAAGANINDGTGVRGQIFYIVGPTTGNIVATFDFGIDLGASMVSMVFENVDQTTPVENTGYGAAEAGTDTQTDITGTIVDPNNMLVIGGVHNLTSGLTITSGTSVVSTGGNSHGVGAGYIDLAAGAFTEGMSGGSTDTRAVSGIQLKAAS